MFERSIEALRILNGLGYGVADSGLQLDLVYNPGGAFLAPDQIKLEEAYKEVCLSKCSHSDVSICFDEPWKAKAHAMGIFLLLGCNFFIMVLVKGQ